MTDRIHEVKDRQHETAGLPNKHNCTAITDEAVFPACDYFLGFAIAACAAARRAIGTLNGEQET